MIDLKDIDGKKFCVVFCKAQEGAAAEVDAGGSSQVEMSTMHGFAKVIDGKTVQCVTEDGSAFAIPLSAQKKIFPSDGTDILKDSEYFVIVKVSGMDLA